MTHAILIVSAASQARAEALGQAMGWGPDNYTIPLTNRADGVTSHYGLSTPVSDEFLALYAACLAGTPPPGIPEALISVVPLILADFDGTGTYATPLDHLEAVLAAQGLARVP